MAQPIYRTITATGTTIIPVDGQQSPFNLAYAVEVPAETTISFTVQFTLDDVNDASWTAVWIADPTDGGAQTATAAGSYTTPIRALQVTVASISGGNARLTIVQGSSAR
jgi:hypothetical protein